MSRIHGGTAVKRCQVNTVLCKITPVAAAMLATANVMAVDFNFGPVSVTSTGSVTAGAMMSTEKPDARWVNAKNAELAGADVSGQPNKTAAVDGDDGRLNWSKGDIVSSPITLLSENTFKYDRYGAFIQAKAWYDYTLDTKKVPHGHSLNGYEKNATLNDSGFHRLARFEGVELMEAYVYGDFNVAGTPLHVRAGNQVIKWGESRFFLNGINSINPIDVAAFQRPGSRPVDALRPAPHLYLKADLTDSLQLETFYQLAWKESVLPGCGTFFSGLDYFPGECNGLGAKAAFPDPTDYNDHGAWAAGSYIPRGPDQKPGDSGQFGVSLSHVDESSGVSLGLYAMQIHSRNPLPSAVLSSDPDKNDLGNPGWEYNGVDGSTPDSAVYIKDYAEDIRIFGASVSGQLAGWSLFGEYSYRPNQPITYHTGDSIPAVFGATADLAGLGLSVADDVLAGDPGSFFRGYDREKVSQLSFGGMSAFPSVLGADNFTFIGEVAVKYVHDLPSLDDVRYGRPNSMGTNFSSSQTAGSPGCNLGVQPHYQSRVCSDDGFVTDLAWGYRVRGQLNYRGVLPGFSLSPFAVFSHDVEGYSYDNEIMEGRLHGRVGVTFDYADKYSAEILYSTSGGNYWAKTDRDYLALSTRMAF